MQLIDNPKTDVLKYTFIKNEEDIRLDFGYKEEIYIELKKDKKGTYLKNKITQNPNIVFGKFSFNRTHSGYYKISKMSFQNIKNQITFEIKEDSLNNLTQKIQFNF